MKTKINNMGIPGKRLWQALIMLIGIGLFNAAMACTANFTYTIGANGHVSFTNTSSGFTYPWCTWDPGDASGMMYGSAPSHIYTANGTYNVTLVASDSSCTDSITIPITITNVTSPCTLNASFTVSYGSHGNVTFTSTSTGTNVNTLYFWNPGDGTGRISGTTTYNHTYIYKGNYTVYLTIEDTGLGYCIDSIPMGISVTNADSNGLGCNLVVNFTYSIGANGNVSFTSTTTGSGLFTFIWDPGDLSGTTTNPYNITTYHHSYLANGTYNVKLVVDSWDSGYCADSITIPVTINNVDSLQPCTLSPSFNITYDSSGQVTFTSTSTGTYANTLYYWNPGDGSGTQLGSPVFTYTYPFIGNYTATLILKDTGSGYCIDSVSMPVNVYNKDSLEASFIYSSDSLVPGEYTFYSTSKGTNANTYYRWDAGDGSPADSGIGMTTYTHTYAINGPYAATLTIWYTVLPKAPSRVDRLSGSPRYDESSYTQVINVSTAPSGIVTVTNTPGNFSLYPNPNDGMFRLILNNVASNGNAEVSVSNVLGQEVFSTPVSVSNHTLNENMNLQHIGAGVYFVKVITSGKMYTAKLVIQR